MSSNFLHQNLYHVKIVINGNVKEMLDLFDGILENPNEEAAPYDTILVWHTRFKLCTIETYWTGMMQKSLIDVNTNLRCCDGSQNQEHTDKKDVLLFSLLPTLSTSVISRYFYPNKVEYTFHMANSASSKVKFQFQEGLSVSYFGK